MQKIIHFFVKHPFFQSLLLWLVFGIGSYIISWWAHTMRPFYGVVAVFVTGLLLGIVMIVLHITHY